MEIILLEDIANLGFKDEIVKVKPGFARNFLIPNKKAIYATISRKKQLLENLKQKENKNQEIVKSAQVIADKLKELDLKITAKVIEKSNKLFGSITASNVVEVINKQGFELDKKFVKMKSIKQLGAYEAHIRLHKDVDIKLNFEVISA
tara:strand:+ start:775 stop:1218 length:444 start_codon:yes stop_codon:yes gene_type:complete